MRSVGRGFLIFVECSEADRLLVDPGFAQLALLASRSVELLK
jgi:hypothetical protein